jgi:hypothetical protein
VHFSLCSRASRDVIHNEAFSVGRDEDVVQIRTIAEQVSEITSAPVSFAEGAGPDTRNYQVDFTKIRAKVPAFNPQWTVPQGIEEIWKDAHDRGLTTEDFEGPRFVRLQRIQQLASHVERRLQRHPQLRSAARRNRINGMSPRPWRRLTRGDRAARFSPACLRPRGSA